MKKELVSVIIPNLNGMKYLDVLLTSIFEQSYRNIETIVIDNGSTDGSLEYLSRFKNVKTITNTRNMGFAKAVNRGIKESLGNYIFILNNDTELDNKCIEELTDSFSKISRKHRNVAGLSPKILLDQFNRKLIDSVGMGILPDGSAMNRGIGQIDLGQYDKINQVMGICFAAAFISKEALTNIGILDKSYFAYYEDVDWCYRSNMLGYRFYTCPTALVYHKHSGSAKELLTYDYKYYLIHRNFLRTIIKNYYRGNQLWTFRRARVYLYEAAYRLINGPRKKSITYLHILADTFFRLPRLMLFNYNINRKRKIFDQAIWNFSEELLFKLGGQTFDPATYSPIFSIDNMLNILENMGIFEDEDRFANYLSLVALKNYLLQKIYPRYSRNLLKLLKGKENEIMAEPVRNPIGYYKISISNNTFFLDFFLTYILFRSLSKHVNSKPIQIDSVTDKSSVTNILNRGNKLVIEFFKQIGVLETNKK